MSYLLILVVLVVALSPLFSMLPSRRQRHIARLRQAAATSGLYVKLERGDDDVETVFYGCRRQRGDAGAAPASALRGAEGWAIEGGDWPGERLALLGELPEAVMQVREDRQGIGVFWNEQGSPEDVHQIAAVLRKLLGRHW
jgi:hypothetical protein